MNNKVFLIFLALLISNLSGENRIILSTALTENHYDFRKKEYIHSFSNLIAFGYSDFYIVEALANKGPTFLDTYCNHVFYATDNNATTKNQGINESKTILEALRHFNFNPDDIIIKLTGRHRLISDYFLKLIENNPDYDAFVKVCSGLMPAWADGMILTMCFAMKNKHLIEMYETIDYKAMEEQSIPIEWIIASYLDRKTKDGSMKLYVVDKLDIRVNAFASSAAPGQPEKIFIF